MSQHESLEALRVRIGVQVPLELLEAALTHRSFSVENNGATTYERLEFLGDAALGCVVAEFMFLEHPEASEAQLTPLRAAIINAHALADAARTLNLGPSIRLGKGELTQGGQEKTSILADVMESLMGAVYLTHGMHAAREFVLRVMATQIRDAVELGAGLDWKTSLQELVAARKLSPPRYEVDVEGPDHSRTFTARVVIEDEVLGHGVGTSKRHAERSAAAQAYSSLVAGNAAGAGTAVDAGNA